MQTSLQALECSLPLPPNIVLDSQTHSKDQSLLKASGLPDLISICLRKAQSSLGLYRHEPSQPSRSQAASRKSLASCFPTTTNFQLFHINQAWLFREYIGRLVSTTSTSFFPSNSKLLNLLHVPPRLEGRGREFPFSSSLLGIQPQHWVALTSDSQDLTGWMTSPKFLTSTKPHLTHL